MIEVKKTKLEGIKYYYLYVFDSQKMPIELRKRCYALKNKKPDGVKFLAVRQKKMEGCPPISRFFRFSVPADFGSV